MLHEHNFEGLETTLSLEMLDLYLAYTSAPTEEVVGEYLEQLEMEDHNE